MDASQFTDALFIIKQGEDGIPVAEMCRKGGDQLGDLFT